MQYYTKQQHHKDKFLCPFAQTLPAPKFVVKGACYMVSLTLWYIKLHIWPTSDVGHSTKIVKHFEDCCSQRMCQQTEELHGAIPQMLESLSWFKRTVILQAISFFFIQNLQKQVRGYSNENAELLQYYQLQVRNNAIADLCFNQPLFHQSI